MSKETLMTIAEYAKYIGKSRAQVYMDIRLGKISNFITRPVKTQLLIVVNKNKYAKK